MKKIIKKILGKKLCEKIKIDLLYIKSIPKIIFNRTVIVNNEKIDKLKIYGIDNKNVFCGYYDLEPIKYNKMLVHVAKKNSNTKKDSIELGYYDLSDDKYNKITTTKAWCWQQGSRLRWSQNEKDIIYFNDVENNNYCCKKFDIKSKKIVKIFNDAFYDIDASETYGAFVNFSRLQRLRPGYGYDVLDDITINDNAPKEDGLFIANLKNGTTKMIISLYELANSSDKELKYEHYINHISFSPNGEKIMFFHLWNEVGDFNWNNELCVIDTDGKNLQILENEDIVSHYDWKNNNELLITGVSKKTKEEFYRMYNVLNNKKNELLDVNLKRDGHPTFSSNKDIFYSDTYPNQQNMQTLFEYSIDEEKYYELLSVFSNPTLNGEKRCDLHPKIILDSKLILIDSTYEKKKRNVIMIKLKDMK